MSARRCPRSPTPRSRSSAPRVRGLPRRAVSRRRRRRRRSRVRSRRARRSCSRKQGLRSAPPAPLHARHHENPGDSARIATTSASSAPETMKRAAFVVKRVIETITRVCLCGEMSSWPPASHGRPRIESGVERDGEEARVRWLEEGMAPRRTGTSRPPIQPRLPTCWWMVRAEQLVARVHRRRSTGDAPREGTRSPRRRARPAEAGRPPTGSRAS